MKAVALALSLLCIAPLAQADLRKDIEKDQKLAAAALLKKDIVAFDKIMKKSVTPDFKYVEGKKTLGYSQMIATMKMGLDSMQKVTISEVKIVSIKEQGNTATVKIEQKLGGIVKGEGTKTHTMMFSGISSDSYVKKGGRWMQSKMQWISQTMTMDGKKMPG